MSDTATDATTADQAAHDDHEPSERQYVEIAVVLAVLTIMEFSTYFVEFGVLHIPVLVILMLIKFGLVVGFFMHLKFDTRLYRQLLLTGFIGAITLYTIVLLALAEFPAGT